jgi:hypothetical protein
MSKQEEMFALMKEHEHSGLTIDAFCSARALKVSRFYYWRRKFRASRVAPGGFIPILPSASTEGHSIRLSYPNGVNIHLPAADIALIAQLIRLA